MVEIKEGKGGGDGGELVGRSSQSGGSEEGE